MAVAVAAAILGHSVEVNHGAYVKAHRDTLERDRARQALVELGLSVASHEVQKSLAALPH